MIARRMGGAGRRAGFRGIGGGTAAPFTPSALGSKTLLWLKADAGITTVADKVSAWADQSGNSRDASQSTDANRPDFAANTRNGLPVVQFRVASSEYMDLAMGDIAAGSFTVFAAYDLIDTLDTYAVIDTGTNGGGRLGVFARLNSGAVGYIYGSNLSVNVLTVASGWAVREWHLQATNQGEIRRDGTLLGSAGQNYTASGFASADGHRLGARNDAGDHWANMDLGELVFCQALSAAERVEMRAYMQARWG